MEKERVKCVDEKRERLFTTVLEIFTLSNLEFRKLNKVYIIAYITEFIQ